MALLTINGRQHFVNVDRIEVHEVAAGYFAVSFDGKRQFDVIGGLASGGAANEWFCFMPELYGNQWLRCNSMVAAIKMGAMY